MPASLPQIVEAGDYMADQVQTIVKGAIEEAFKQIISGVQFLVELTIADSWKS